MGFLAAVGLVKGKGTYDTLGKNHCVAEGTQALPFVWEFGNVQSGLN